MKLTSFVTSMEVLHDITQNLAVLKAQFEAVKYCLDDWVQTGLGLRRSPNILFLLTKPDDQPELVRQQGCVLAWKFSHKPILLA
jgi:hypothetical protein